MVPHSKAPADDATSGARPPHSSARSRPASFSPKAAASPTPRVLSRAGECFDSPKIREGGRWGLSSSGHFQLADDEALVLTLDPIGAKYLAVQLASGWLGSLDYLHHTASLNLSQAKPNPRWHPDSGRGA